MVGNSDSFIVPVMWSTILMWKSKLNSWPLLLLGALFFLVLTVGLTPLCPVSFSRQLPPAFVVGLVTVPFFFFAFYSLGEFGSQCKSAPARLLLFIITCIALLTFASAYIASSPESECLINQDHMREIQTNRDENE